MKFIHSCITGLVILLFFLVPTSSGAQRNAALDTVKDEQFWLVASNIDYGQLLDREAHLDSLFLVNALPTTTVIENVRTTCGCTAATWPVAPIQPGEPFTIPITFRCLKSGYMQRKVEIWLSGKRKPLIAYVAADCP